jgi:hypothetical protein
MWIEDQEIVGPQRLPQINARWQLAFGSVG